MRPVVLAGLFLACLLASSCAPARNFDVALKSIVKPYLFSIAGWESQAMTRELIQWVSGRQETVDDEISLVTGYFSATERIKLLRLAIKAAKDDGRENVLTSLQAELNSLQERKTALAETVERIIAKQIRETLAEQGIFNPLIKLKVTFPPVNFRLEKPPNLLVISPRDRIESLREITLRTDLTLKEIEGIEARVDELGVSSLVVEIGGLGATFPTFVTNEASLQFTLDTTAEEWLHQYLVLKPLGFLYLLDITGLARNYDIATINETLASMVSQEIGAIVYEKYYASDNNGTKQSQTAKPGFDFNREMREIRQTVDGYLAQGKIELAEEFMEQKRQYLASMGYDIRKLNQAYFAFHGTYADSPTSISPIGVELRALREQSASLKEFLDTVAGMTTRQELADSIEQ